VNPDWKYAVFGAILGATFLGLAGAAYGAVLYLNPDYRDSLIREELSRPHPDNPRYVAAIVALRYQGFTELIIRKSIAPFVIGGLLGAAVGSGLAQFRRRKQVHSSDLARPRRFTLVELLVVTAIVGILVAMLQPIGGSGLVYYDGKDQFYWLEQLEFGPALARPTAITALCSLLERKPFPCRSTIISALADCDGDARPAIPILEILATDTEESVKTAAADALLKLKAVAGPDGAREWPIASESNR
jgi:prepilin-type N-terminal cleavage/methylation domain-containing protein